MNHEQLDQIYNLIHALSGRIEDLEGEMRELGYRVLNAENEIDTLKWRTSYNNNGY